jgi:hypothetical protein
MRRLRERRTQTATDPILFERADWRLFIDPYTLPQKAGCEPRQIGLAILKELVDNSLDCNARNVTVTGDAQHALVRDDGPGIDPALIPALFAVNRPMLSSKLKRLPTRGMLGNGLRVVMGAVTAHRGKITVTSRDVGYELAINTVTGATEIVQARSVPPAGGTAVELHFPRRIFDAREFVFAREIVAVAGFGTVYAGFSQRAWYSRKAVEQLIAAAPKDATVREITEDVFGIGVDDIDLLPITPFYRVDIGQIGDVFAGCYRIVHGTADIDQAGIPFCVEAWVEADNAEKNEGTYTFHPFINRTHTLARLTHWADSAGLRIHGCGLDFKVAGAKRAVYTLGLSIITPLVQLTGDGKAPFLGHFGEAIEKAIGGAAREAYQQMVRPPTSMTLKDAAWLVERRLHESVWQRRTSRKSPTNHVCGARRPPPPDRGQKVQ